MSRRSVIWLAPVLNLILACLLLVPVCAASDWKYEETHNESREFVAGGHLRVRMTVGDVRIHRGETTKIKLEYTVRSKRERNVKEARVDFDVHGNDATVEFHGPSSGNTQYDVELEVPMNTNLDVHDKVGDLTVENVEGDKDLSLGVGDIRIENEHPGYRIVNASAGIGDINADGYGEARGG
jgi:hypothetical protein